MIAKLAGIIDQVGAGCGGHRCRRRRLSGLLLDPHDQPAAAAGLAGAAADRDACARGPHPSLRLCRRRGARLVPPADDRAGRRRPAGAGDPLGRGAGAADARHPGAGQGGAGARRRGRPEARRPHRQRAAGQGRPASPPLGDRPGGARVGGARRRGRRRGRCGLGAGQSRLSPGRGLRRRRRGGSAARQRRRDRRADPRRTAGARRDERRARRASSIRRPPSGTSAETSLRPLALDEFVGQRQLRDNLRVFIDAAKSRARSPRPRALLGPARARQDDPRADRRARDGGGLPRHLRPGHPARRRSRRRC